MKTKLRTVFLLALVCGSGAAQLAPMQSLSARPMSKDTRELFAQSMRLFDASYDPQVHLLLHPHDGGTHVMGKYMVRESSWYALGLLMRDRNGDRPADAQRAIAVLGAVLDEQYLDPNVKWAGTFKRTPEEPAPALGTIAFTGYDPNWRQFIGTTFEAILVEFPKRLSPELTARMYRAIDAAVAGEMHDGRLLPSYSNIALMYGALWDFAAVHDKNAEWKTQSAAWTEEVYRLYRQHDAFFEYNAPTYYGVDLYGLALWRDYGSTARMRLLGRLMEAGLWKDIAQFYQPNLRNLAGPYDRAYGMDMSRYVTPTGVWMRTVLEGARAPLPEESTLQTYQVADMWFAPQIILMSTHIPDEAMTKIRHFIGPHLVRRQIDAQRVATAWVGENAMWGGESTGGTKDTGRTQFHPVTAHWRMPDGQIGWIKVTRSPNIDAVADKNGVTITTNGAVQLRIFTGEAEVSIAQTEWKLPGLTVDIVSDENGFSAVKAATGPDSDGSEDVTYSGVHTMRLEMHPADGK